MDTLFNIIMNPVKTFNQLKTEEKFPIMAFIILLTFALINMILMVPVNAKISELLFSNMSLPEEQMDMIIQMTHKMRYLSLIGGLIMYAIVLFACSLLLYVIALIFRTQLTYSKALRLIIYCFIVLVIGDIINMIFVYYRGVDNIESMYSAMLTGANLLTSVEKAGVFLYMFFSYINPFQIWFVVLLTIGVKIFTDSGWAKSCIICIIYWLIVTIIPVLSTCFSQMTLANKGLI